MSVPSYYSPGVGRLSLFVRFGALSLVVALAHCVGSRSAYAALAGTKVSRATWNRNPSKLATKLPPKRKPSTKPITGVWYDFVDWGPEAIYLNDSLDRSCFYRAKRVFCVDRGSL